METPADSRSGQTTNVQWTDETTIIARRPALSEELYREGDVIDGQYEVLRVLGGTGKSGMGVVYIVQVAGRTFAMKSIQRRHAKNLAIVERFLREARTWMLLGFHPHIVHAYSVDVIDSAPFLMLEYAPPDENGSVTLGDHIKQGPLPIDRVFRFAIHCVEGMLRATTAIPNLVHRDLKPDNLLIARGETLKVTDYGLVRTRLARELDDKPAGVETNDGAPGFDDDPATRYGDGAFGTPPYMAPEQFDGAGSVGKAADIYAFGCCFYEAITGSRLFTAEATSGLKMVMEYRDLHFEAAPDPIESKRPDCPAELSQVIMRCIEKRPEARWQDWETLREALMAAHESAFAVCFVPERAKEPSAMEVAAQIRSLTLLDGYSRAVHLRNLREQQEASPYAFHLALASYFHVHDEREEAMRQLQRAARIDGSHDGYEAVHRLASLLIEDGSLEEARRILEAYIESHAASGVGLERVLEPAVRLAIAEGDHARAEAYLQPIADSRRGRILLAEVLLAADRLAELHVLLTCELKTILQSIRETIAELAEDDTVAWGHHGDREALIEVLSEMDPDFDPTRLERAAHSVWPDLEGYPDFAEIMARLSELLGRLSELHGHVTETERETFARHARRLDFPNRKRNFISRDENWFWRRGGL